MSFIYSVLKDPQKKCLIESTQLFGVPKFTIIDVQASVAKNLALKIRSAILNQGFKWSLRKQFIVELESEKVDLKNNGQVELAIAIKFLIGTDQLIINDFAKIVCVGSVNIHGKIFASNIDTSISQSDELWVGSFDESNLPLNYCDIKDLSDLKNLNIKKKSMKNIASPVFTEELNFTEAVIAHGKHNCIYFSNDQLKLKKSFEKINTYLNANVSRVTHQSHKNINFVDSSSRLDQILSSHSNGFLLLNDFLFSKEHLTKNFFSYVERNHINFVILYTLCPCGKAKLGKPKKCGLSLYRCRSKVEKLSVGSLSYFDLCFSEINTNVKINSESLRKARELQLKRDQKLSNNQCGLEELYESLSERAKSLLYMPKDLGLKRQTSILSVARTVADLNGNEFIETSDIDQSMNLSFNGFKTLINTF